MRKSGRELEENEPSRDDLIVVQSSDQEEVRCLWFEKTSKCDFEVSPNGRQPKAGTPTRSQA